MQVCTACCTETASHTPVPFILVACQMKSHNHELTCPPLPLHHHCSKQHFFKLLSTNTAIFLHGSLYSAGRNMMFLQVRLPACHFNPVVSLFSTVHMIVIHFACGLVVVVAALTVGC